jgi:MFS family permease
VDGGGPGLFRHRDFVLLWSGQSVSELGSSVTYLALPLVAVLVLHASAIEVSLVTAATSVAWLLVGLPAGVWVDRLPRRALLIATDAGRALLMASLPVAWLLHVLTIGHLIGVAFGIGLLGMLFDIGYPAYLPAVLDGRSLVAGNSALSASESAANVVGPSLGGVLVQALGAPVALLVDAASFVASAASLALIRVRGLPVGQGPRRRLAAEIAEGFRYLLAHPLARTVAVNGMIANFTITGYQAVIVLFLARQVGLAPGVIGVLFTLGAVGGLAGSFAAAPLARLVGDARVMWGGALVIAAGGPLVPLTTRGTGIIWYVAGTLLMNLGIVAFNVCVRAAMQAAAPDAMRGRVIATVRLFTRGVSPVGALAGGALAGSLTPRSALVILVALLALPPVWLLLSPVAKVRDVAQLAPATDA